MMQSQSSLVATHRSGSRRTFGARGHRFGRMMTAAIGIILVVTNGGSTTTRLFGFGRIENGLQAASAERCPTTGTMLLIG